MIDLGHKTEALLNILQGRWLRTEVDGNPGLADVLLLKGAQLQLLPFSFASCYLILTRATALFGLKRTPGIFFSIFPSTRAKNSGVSLTCASPNGLNFDFFARALFGAKAPRLQHCEGQSHA
jgi:hypothetical protein